MKALICSVILTMVMVWVAAAGGDAQAGKASYDKSCKTCHGPKGEGNKALAKALKVEIRDLGAKEVQAQSDDEFKKAISKGKGKMQPVKTLSAKDVDNVVAFMRTLAKK